MNDFPSSDPSSSEDSLLIDCATCVMAQTPTCSDCVVTFLCSETDLQLENESSAMIFDFAEILALRTLAQAGLVPTLRHRAHG